MPVSRAVDAVARGCTARCESGTVFAAGPARQHSKRSASPKAIGELGARPKQQRGILTPEPLQKLSKSFRVGQGRSGLTEICPPFAKLSQGQVRPDGHHLDLVAALREIHALVVAMTPAPRNDHSNAPSDRNKRGKARAVSPLERIYTLDFRPQQALRAASCTAETGRLCLFPV